jgi:hypothetical protein
VDQTTPKLEEIKSLVKNAFPGMDADILLNIVRFEIIQGKGNINLDNCLQLLEHPIDKYADEFQKIGKASFELTSQPWRHASGGIEYVGID